MASRQVRNALYKVVDKGDNHYEVMKFTQDFELLETYHTNRLSEASMVCSCPAPAYKTCRHQTMVGLFINQGALKSGAFYNYDKQTWLAANNPEDDDA